MAEESARPYFTYSPLYPAERAFTKMFAEIERGDVLMPSPLLTFTSPQIRLHFQYGPDGRLSSPQVPAGNMRDLAETRYLSPELIELAGRRLEELGKLVSRKELASMLSVDEPTQQDDANPLLAFGPELQSRSSNEYVMRSRTTRLAQKARAGGSSPFPPDRRSTRVRSRRSGSAARCCWRVASASSRAHFCKAAGSTGMSSAPSWPPAPEISSLRRSWSLSCRRMDWSRRGCWPRCRPD